MRALLALILWSVALLALAQPPSTEQLTEMRAVVKPLVNHNDTGSASAVVLSKGRLVTSAHVVGRGQKLYLKRGTEKLETRVLTVDRENDLALLEADVDCPCATLAAAPLVDRAVYTVGYPLGVSIDFVQFLTEGRVQAVNKHGVWTDAPTVPGNSGGGVFQLQDGTVVLIGVSKGILGNAVTLFPHLSAAAEVAHVARLLR